MPWVSSEMFKKAFEGNFLRVLEGFSEVGGGRSMDLALPEPPPWPGNKQETHTRLRQAFVCFVIADEEETGGVGLKIV